MPWLTDLFAFSGSVAHSVIALSLVISIGIFLGKFKVAGISLGLTWVLFAGITLSHFGLRLETELLHFLREFGLILFVYAIGLQVGPGFFASFKEGGVALNLLAVTMVALGVAITVILHFVTGTPITTMVGIMSGAVTNTPGMGAAQQVAAATSGGTGDPTIAVGYALAYPLAVVGIISSIIAIRYIFKIDVKKERAEIENLKENNKDAPRRVSLRIENPAIDGQTVAAVHDFINRNFVITRVRRLDGTVDTPSALTPLKLGEDILLVTSTDAAPAITAFFGKEINVDWAHQSTDLISKGIIITKPALNGKTISQTRIRSLGLNVTRVTRSGLNLVPSHNLHLQIGDSLNIVGTERALAQAEKILGNSHHYLNEPHLFPIFLGIFLGVIAGSIPFVVPGMPQPVKLGLAGGPLIISILIARFGHNYGLVTYSAAPATFMLREIGISIFLACVGISAGEGFVDAIKGGGYVWVGYGILITVIPIFVVGTIGRLKLKLNYFTLSGLIAGSITDPPALAYANETAKNGAPAVAYSTVYPLTMFLRILGAQLLVIVFL